MKFRTLIRPVVLAFTVISILAPSANATLFQGYPQGSDRQALSIEDLVENPFSYIRNNPLADAVQAGQGVETADSTKFCDEFNTRGCNLTGSADLTVNSIIPVCASAIENCIEKLEITKSDGTVVTASFVRYFKGKTFAGISELGMPGGSRVSLWEAKGAPNLGGTELYAVNAKVIWRYLNGNALVNNFSASVYAVKENSDSRYKDSGIWVGPAFNGVYASVTETGEFEYDGTCVATEAGNCAKKVEFAPETRVKLVMKLSNKVTGWLHGRIAKPEISVTPIDSLYNTLSVSANTVNVSMMYAAFNQSEMTADFLQKYKNSMNVGRGLFGISFWKQFPPSNPFSSAIITTLGDSIKNTATEVHSYWNLTSLPQTSNNPCMADTSKLIGFVTTNAMAYEGNAPQWDGESLQYKVAGLHYLPDGKTLTSGSYDLAMRSETARCLYGFTNAPISATISVTSADGDQKVATTVLNEKNGWLYLAAYGFSFSAPTIKIKLTQEKPKEAAPSPSPSSTATKAPVKSIKCIKGKSVKTVKGANPKCPAGYKQK